MAHAYACECLATCGWCHEAWFPCRPLQVDRAKVLSNTIKQKRKQKAGKWEVPLPKVSALQAARCKGWHA